MQIKQGINGPFLASVWAWFAGTRGATAVEFALTAPIVLGLIFGAMEGGRAIFTQAVLNHAAQSTTRWAIVNPPAAGQTAQQYSDSLEVHANSKLILISPNKVATSTATSPTNPADNTRTITISVSYDFDWMLPFVGAATGPIRLSAMSSGFLAENF